MAGDAACTLLTGTDDGLTRAAGRVDWFGRDDVVAEIVIDATDALLAVEATVAAAAALPAATAADTALVATEALVAFVRFCRRLCERVDAIADGSKWYAYRRSCLNMAF